MTLVVNIWNSADSEFLLFERGLGINANVDQLSLVFLVLQLWTSTLVRQRMKRSWKKIQLRQSLQQKKKRHGFCPDSPPQRLPDRERGHTGSDGKEEKVGASLIFLPFPLSPVHFNISLFPISETFLSAWFNNLWNSFGKKWLVMCAYPPGNRTHSLVVLTYWNESCSVQYGIVISNSLLQDCLQSSYPILLELSLSIVLWVTPKDRKPWTPTLTLEP